MGLNSGPGLWRPRVKELHMVSQIVTFILYFTLGFGLSIAHAKPTSEDPLLAAATVIDGETESGEAVRLTAVAAEGAKESRFLLNKIMGALNLPQRKNEAVFILTTLDPRKLMDHVDPENFQSAQRPHTYGIFNIPRLGTEAEVSDPVRSDKINALMMARRQTALNAATYIFLSDYPIPARVAAIFLASVLNTDFAVAIEKWRRIAGQGESLINSVSSKLGVSERITGGSRTFDLARGLSVSLAISFGFTSVYSGIHAWNQFGDVFLNWNTFSSHFGAVFMNSLTAVMASGVWDKVFRDWVNSLRPDSKVEPIRLSVSRINVISRWKSLFMATIGPALQMAIPGAHEVAIVMSVAGFSTFFLSPKSINRIFDFKSQMGEFVSKWSIDLSGVHELSGFKFPSRQNQEGLLSYGSGSQLRCSEVFAR
jgi:hypothetical protein